MSARSSLAKLIQLGIVVVIGYLAVTRGWPYLRQRLAAAEASTPPRTIASDESGRCLDLAEEAVEVFDDGIDAFLSPPVDDASWSRFISGVENHVRESRNECARCSEPECSRAMEAIDGVAGLLVQLDAAFRRNGEVPDPRERRAIIRRSIQDALSR